MAATFKTSLFGGFDREDVISYIEKTARENRERIQELTDSAESLQRDNKAVRQELETVRQDLMTARQKMESMRQAAENARSVTEKYEALRASVDEVLQRAKALEAENKNLRVQAAEYQSMKDHIAEIEISAHRRTQEFRAAAIEELHGVVAQQRSWFEQQRAQYTDLHEGIRERLQAAQNALGELDLEGFDRMEQDLADLDRKLDE